MSVAQMNILQALDDPAIFAPVFPNKASWIAWRTFLAALFALPMGKKELAIYRECTNRQDPPLEAVEEAWLCVGRKGGKSRVLALIATFVASFIDWSKYLSVGERGIVMVVAQDRAAAELIMGYIAANFRAVPESASA